MVIFLIFILKLWRVKNMGSLLVKYDISDFIQKWESYMNDLLNQIEIQRKKNKDTKLLIEIYKKMNFINNKMLEILNMSWDDLNDDGG